MMRIENYRITLTAIMCLLSGVAGAQTPTQFEDQHLLASDGAGGDFKGISVSISGSVSIVGAWQDDTAGGVEAGSAYVYRLSGATWIEEAHLFASDGMPGDFFGRAVAIYGTPGSEVAIVGAYFDDTNAGTDAGSVYVYRFNGAGWIEEAHLFASNASFGDYFGNSVSVYGNVIIIGAPIDSTPGGFFTGSSYVFRFNGTTWVEEEILSASDATIIDQFGDSVSINGDVAIVGASVDDTDAGGTNAGSAYIYRFNGKVWVEEAHLFASDGSADDMFGFSVAVFGNVAIIGARRDDTAGGSGAGSAFVYRFNGTNWVEEAHLFASDGQGGTPFGEEFGYSASICGAPGSEVAIIGALFDDTAGGPDSGSAYIYRFNGSNWVEELHLFPADGAASDSFGVSVSISGQPGNEVAIVGSIFDDTAAGTDAGSAYIFDIPGPPAICTGDITPAGGNGVVNIDDLVAVLNAFGFCPGCPEDITPPGGNGVVNIDDLVAILNAFGACP